MNRYEHAWGGMQDRSRSLVVDPAAWGYATTGPRDSVDLGHAAAPRFWNTCSDVNTGMSRHSDILPLDSIHYVDFKLFRTSSECAEQWQFLDSWLSATKGSSRVLHTVNDGRDLEYDRIQIRNRFKRVRTDEGLHVDIVVKVPDLNHEAEGVAAVLKCIAGWEYASCVISCAWHGLAYAHIIKHPRYERGSRIVRTY